MVVGIDIGAFAGLLLGSIEMGIAIGVALGASVGVMLAAALCAPPRAGGKGCRAYGGASGFGRVKREDCRCRITAKGKCWNCFPTLKGRLERFKPI